MEAQEISRQNKRLEAIQKIAEHFKPNSGALAKSIFTLVESDGGIKKYGINRLRLVLRDTQNQLGTADETQILDEVIKFYVKSDYKFPWEAKE